jgi:hypothetical protein
VISFFGSLVISADFKNNSYACFPTGYSEATPNLVTMGIWEVGGDVKYQPVELSADIGSSPFFPSAAVTQSISITSSNEGSIIIGSNYWTADNTDSEILKDGTAVTISGTARFGPLGHDPTNSYLLVLYSTTKIAKFSGISGTTITNVNSDVTLDTAVTATRGFLYDDVNDQYVCVDTTNNLVRKFNSSGTTVSTASYTITDTNVYGVCYIEDRVYLIVNYVIDTNENSCGGLGYGFVPTTMTR